MFYKYHYEFTFRSFSNAEARRRKIYFLQLAVSAKLEENTRKWNFLFFLIIVGQSLCEMSSRNRSWNDQEELFFWFRMERFETFPGSLPKISLLFHLRRHFHSFPNTKKWIFILKITFANNFSKISISFSPLYLDFLTKNWNSFDFCFTSNTQIHGFHRWFLIISCDWLIGNWLLTKY